MYQVIHPRKTIRIVNIVTQHGRGWLAFGATESLKAFVECIFANLRKKTLFFFTIEWKQAICGCHTQTRSLGQDFPLGGNPEVGNPETICYQDYPPQLKQYFLPCLHDLGWCSTIFNDRPRFRLFKTYVSKRFFIDIFFCDYGRWWRCWKETFYRFILEDICSFFFCDL